MAGHARHDARVAVRGQLLGVSLSLHPMGPTDGTHSSGLATVTMSTGPSRQPGLLSSYREYPKLWPKNEEGGHGNQRQKPHPSETGYAKQPASSIPFCSDRCPTPQETPLHLEMLFSFNGCIFLVF